MSRRKHRRYWDPWRCYIFTSGTNKQSKIYTWGIKDIESRKKIIEAYECAFSSNGVKYISPEHDVYKLISHSYFFYLGFKDLHSTLLAILPLLPSEVIFMPDRTVTPALKEQLITDLRDIQIAAHQRGLELATGFTDTNQDIEIL